MKTERLTGFGLLLLGTGMVANALLGPLLLGVIASHVSHAMENQQRGGELISLFVAAPVALLAGFLWLRGQRLAPVLAMVPALYALYTYATFVLGPEYSRYPGNNEYAFPLYLALIILGWAIALRSWLALDAEHLPALSTGPRRTVGGLLLAVSLFFALAWTASLVPVLSGGSLPRDYTDDRTMFWLIRLLDLAVVIPAGVVSGLGLLRGAPRATRLGYVLPGFMALLVGSVAGMAIVLAVRHDPAASPVLLVATLVMTGCLGLVSVWLVRHARHVPAAAVLAAPPLPPTVLRHTPVRPVHGL